jgi:hypothetical protein
MGLEWQMLQRWGFAEAQMAALMQHPTAAAAWTASGIASGKQLRCKMSSEAALVQSRTSLNSPKQVNKGNEVPGAGVRLPLQ